MLSFHHRHLEVNVKEMALLLKNVEVSIDIKLFNTKDREEHVY